MARHKSIVSYLRKSKGRGALDINAQREATEQFAQANGFDILEEFVEQGGDGRVKTRSRRLSAAIKRARKDECPILVASLQSLSQDVRSIGDLVAQKTSIIVAGDHPFTLRLYPTLTDEEREHRGQRIRQGHARAREKGVQFGNPTNLNKAGQKGRVAQVKRADNFATEILPTIADIRASGITTYDAIAMELNKRGVKTARGHQYSAMTVMRIVKRRKQLGQGAKRGRD